MYFNRLRPESSRPSIPILVFMHNYINLAGWGIHGPIEKELVVRNVSDESLMLLFGLSDIKGFLGGY